MNQNRITFINLIDQYFYKGAQNFDLPLSLYVLPIMHLSVIMLQLKL